MTPLQPLTVTRELRGNTAHWIHITGSTKLEGSAVRKAAAAASKWAKELGHRRAHRVTTGASFNGPESGGTGTFRYSACYTFTD